MTSGDDLSRRRRCNRSAVPAELLRLPDGALRNDDVDEGGAAVVHRLGEGALQILRVLDKEALAAEGLHHPVVARAVDEGVGLMLNIGLSGISGMPGPMPPLFRCASTHLMQLQNCHNGMIASRHWTPRQAGQFFLRSWEMPDLDLIKQGKQGRA